MGNQEFLFDASRLIWRKWTGRLPTGIDRVCLAYLERYAGQALAVVQRKELRTILSASLSQRLFKLLLSDRNGFRRNVTALLAAAATNSSARGDGRVYLNIGHTGLDATGLPRWLAEQELKPVYLIHDLIPLTHPEFCRTGEARRHRARIRNALMSAHGVISNSAATERDLADFAKSHNLPMPTSVVAWLGADEQAAAAVLPPAKRPYFVMIGTIEARKNHLLMLHVWERLVARFGESAPELVIIGQRGWEADDVFALLDRSPRLKGHVRELGRCDDATMLGWLDNARAMLMPSFTEGFGIPVIEALQRGTPVLASDIPVFREIAGGIPEYIDPLNGQGWESAILRYAENGPDRLRQLGMMADYAPPSWNSHFNIVDGFLRSL